MPNRALRNLSTGEVAPGLYAHVGIGAYESGLRTLENAYVLRTGGVQSRPGTVYLGETKGSGAVRLVAWEFDAEETYLLEFGNLYVRFWLNDVLVAPDLVANGGSWLAWDVATNYVEGQYAQSSSIWYRALRATVGDTPASSALDWVADPVYQITTPYTTAQLDGLQFLQDEDGMRIVHPDHAPRRLAREADDSWDLNDIFFGFTVDAPANPTTDESGTGGVAYVVTALSSVYGTESVASVETETDIDVFNISSSNVTVSWDAVTGATSYNIYRAVTKPSTYSAAFYAYQGTVAAPTVSFVDSTIAITDNQVHPPTSPGLFAQAGDYPGVIGSFQQRVLYSGSDNAPATTNASRSAEGDLFTPEDATSLVASDPIEWTQVARKLNRTRHFLDVGQLLALTSEGEWVIDGNEAGLLVGNAPPNIRKYTEWGAAEYPPPVVVGDSAVFVQARGGVLRDVAGVRGQTLQGTDLTLTASHLVDGYTIADMDYQQTPQSIIWAARSDGVLLSLTYQKEAGVFGWARHITDGTVERVCVLTDETEDATYLVVNRTIDGSTVRYIERLANRQTAYPDTVCADAALVTAGVGAHETATLSLDFTSSTFTALGQRHTAVVATSSAATFVSTDAGRSFNVVKAGTAYRCIITTYTNTTTVTVTVIAPSGLFSQPEVFATGDWYWTSISGLDHLEGETVSVTLDGAVVSSPNAETIEAHGLGTLTLDTSSAVYFIPTDRLTIVLATVGAGTSTLDGSVVGRTLDITVGGTTYPAVVVDLFDDVLQLTINEVPSSGTIADETVIAADDWAWTSLPYTMLGSDSSATNRGVRQLGNTAAFTDAIVGLPFTVAIETLDIDAVERTTKSGTFLIKQVGVWVEETLGLYAGDSATTLQPFPVVDRDENPVTVPQTAYVVCNIEGRYSSGGRIRLQHVDPTPLTVLAIMPHGDFPR